jgi:magnesium-transporting ATPase (P-type)
VKSVRSLSLEDRAISEMLKSMGFLIRIVKREGLEEGFGDEEMSLSNYTKYSVYSPTLNAKQEFNMLCVNSYTKNRARMSFIVQDCSRSNEYMLVVKGEDTAFKGCFNLNKMGTREFNQYKSMLSDYKVQGLKRVVVATKVLSQEEVENYLTTYNIICESSREQLEAFEAHVMKIETDLTFMGCVGVKPIIREDAMTLTQELRAADIQCNILSGDSLDNCLTVAKELGITKALFNDTSTYRYLKIKSEHQGLMDMRRLLDNLYEKLVDQNLETVDYLLGKEREESSPDKRSAFLAHGNQDGFNGKAKDEQEEESTHDVGVKKALMISGDSMPFIVSNPQLRDYFKTILMFSNTVIGFSMQPSHKACVVRLMKEIGNRVMAVGDGLNDLAMFNESNVSVQLCNKDVLMSLADIEVGNLDIIRRLVFCIGAKLNRNIIFASILFFWFTLNWGCIQLFFFATNLYSKSLLTCFQAISLIAIISVLIIIFIVINNPYSDEFLLEYPKAYVERKIVRHNLQKIIIFIICLALLECFILFYTNGVMVANMHTSSGGHLSSSYVAFKVTISLVISNFARVYYAMSRKTIYHHVAFFGSMAAAVGYCFSQLREQGVTKLDFMSSKMLHDIPMAWGFLAYFVGTSVYCSWIVISFIKHKYFIPLSREIGQKLKARKHDFFKPANFSSNIGMLFESMLPKPLQLAVITDIKNCFNSVTIKDPAVQKLLSIDYLNYSWPIDWMNRLKDISERRKFRRVRPEREPTHWKRYILITIGLGTLVYLDNLLIGDFRHTYNMDSADLYFIFFCLMLLWLTHSNLNNRGLLRGMNHLFAFFELIYVVLLIAQRHLPWRPLNILAGRFIMSPINSEFLNCTVLSITNDLAFVIM